MFPEYYKSVHSFEFVNDIFFIVDAFLCFFKMYGDSTTLPQTAWHYIRYL